MTVFDAVHWERDADNDFRLRAQPLPLAAAGDVLAGVRHLDGRGTVILPSPAQVAAGVAFGPDGELEGVLEGGEALAPPTVSITPGETTTVFTFTGTASDSVNTIHIAAPGGAWLPAATRVGNGAVAVSLAPGTYVAFGVTQRDGANGVGLPEGFLVWASHGTWEALRVAVRARLAGLGPRLAGPLTLHIHGQDAPRALPAASFTVAPAPGTVAAADWFEGALTLWFQAERTAQLDALDDAAAALLSGWRWSEAAERAAAGDDGEDDDDEGANAPRGWDLRGFTLTAVTDRARPRGADGRPVLEREIAYRFRARRRSPAPAPLSETPPEATPEPSPEPAPWP